MLCVTQVSACCGSGGRCVTNLFCVSAQSAQIVGTCTDNSWADDACPWALSLSLASPSFISLLISRHVLDKSTAALNFDHFKYSLNTTSCHDDTFCPGPQNQSCCEAKNGKKEIKFDNNAIIPKELKDLSSYYKAAGYTIPSRTAESSTSESTSLLLSSTRDVGTSISSSASLSRSSSIPSEGRDQPSGGSGLNTSAKAVVGAAASIVALLLLISFLYLIRLRRLKHRAVNPVKSAEIEVAEKGPVVEMRGNMGELQGSPTAVEMDEIYVTELAAGK